VVVDESPGKDLYRRVVWGPWREALERAPFGFEYVANRRLGLLAGRFSGGTRAHVAANLARAFPGRTDLDRVARRTFGAHFANQYASFAFGRIDANNWERYLVWEGYEHVTAARAAGEGLVLVHPHMGPAQLPLCVLGARGLPVHQVGGGEPEIEKSETGRWATALRHRLEARMPVTLHAAGGGGGYLRKVLRALADGDIVLTACDGTGGGKEIGRRVERTVLGQRMRVPVGGFWLACRAKARVHTLHVVPDGLRHRAIVGPRIAVPAAPDAAMEAGADATAAFLERVLAAHPEEWHFWDAFEPGRLLA
jgi:lauroyl/myristoyl acyltransferase